MSRRDVLIEKLADCMDRDNAEALVNDVILDEVSTLRAALLQSQAELYNHVACMVTEDSLRERAEVAEEALLQSQEALQKFGKHPASCPKGVGVGYYKPPADAVCECGIDAALLSPPVAPKDGKK